VLDSHSFDYHYGGQSSNSLAAASHFAQQPQLLSPQNTNPQAPPQAGYWQPHPNTISHTALAQHYPPPLNPWYPATALVAHPNERLVIDLQATVQAQAIQLEETRSQLHTAVQRATHYRTLYGREQALSEQVMTSLVQLRHRHRSCKPNTSATTTHHNVAISGGISTAATSTDPAITAVGAFGTHGADVGAKFQSSQSSVVDR
jgi:hypothetical protein